MIWVLYTLATAGAISASVLWLALILHWNACRRVKKEQESKIGEFLEENGYGEMGV